MTISPISLPAIVSGEVYPYKLTISWTWPNAVHPDPTSAIEINLGGFPPLPDSTPDTGAIKVVLDQIKGFFGPGFETSGYAEFGDIALINFIQPMPFTYTYGGATDTTPANLVSSTLGWTNVYAALGIS